MDPFFVSLFFCLLIQGISVPVFLQIQIYFLKKWIVQRNSPKMT